MKILNASSYAAKIIVASIVACWLLLSSATQAQTPGGAKEKSSYRLQKSMAAGEPHDFIVEFVSTESDVRRTIQMAPGNADASLAQSARVTRLNAQKKRVFSTMSTSDLKVLKNYSHLPLEHIQISSHAALRKILSNPEVLHVHENRQEKIQLAESIPLIGANQSISQGYGGSGTAVAVLDTGVDYTHSAFGSCTSPGIPANCKVVFSRDFAPDDGVLDDAERHGTNVAAIVLGVAPATKIIALDVFNGSSASVSDITDAINWVIANANKYNIVAINMSLGGGKYTSPDVNGRYTAAIANARLAGVLTIASAGNNGYTTALGSPAAAPQVISVGAFYDSNVGVYNSSTARCSDTATSALKVTCFSNSTSFLSILAPGTWISAGGIVQSGTSQASPHVAGAVAVLRSAFPADTLDQTVERLLKGQVIADVRNDISKPMLSMPDALNLALPCLYSLSIKSQSFAPAGGAGKISISTTGGCPWTAEATTNNLTWISLSTTNSGSGSGSVSYTVKPNTNVAARTGTISVGGQQFIVSQSGSTDATVNLINNGDFENGPTSWGSATANGMPVVWEYLKPSINNTQYAWLCGYDNCRDIIYQDITLPADLSEAYLRFDYWVDTNELTNKSKYDSISVQVNNPPSATTFATLTTLSNLSSTNGWITSAKYDLTAYKGKTIRVQFTGVTDNSLDTSFYLENVTVMATGAAPDRQPPSIPSGLSARTVNTSSITVSWQSSTDNVGVTSYRLQRDGSLIATLGTSTSYTDSGLGDGTSHRYTVSACDAAGNCSAESLEVTASTQSAVADTQAPSVPGKLVATTISSSSTTLSWSASTDNVGVTNYKIYRNGLLIVTTGDFTSYADSGLFPRTLYSYTVAACDRVGNCSAQSLVAKATTSSVFQNISSIDFFGKSSYSTNAGFITLKMDGILNSSSTYISGSLRIQLWASSKPYTNDGSSGYQMVLSRTSDAGQNDVLGKSSRFSDIVIVAPYLAPPSSAIYRTLFLQEYGNAGCVSVDKWCIIAYRPFHESVTPSIPAQLLATANSSVQVDLAWAASTDNSGVASYKVFRDGVAVATVGNVTSFSDTGLSAASTYRYTVSACDVWGNCSAESLASSASTLAAPDISAPTTPLGLTATAVSSTRVLVAWNASQDNVGVTAYKLYSGTNLVATLGGTITSSYRTNAPAATYSYKVSACDAAGNCSALSSLTLVTTPAAGTELVSTGTFYVPWLTNTSGYVSRFVVSNRASTDASYKIQLLTEGGVPITLVSAFASGILAANSSTVINVSELIAASQINVQAAAVFIITGVLDKISGVYNIVNPITGSISNTTMIRGGASTASTVILPTFSNATSSTNKLIFMNAGTSDASISAKVITESGTTAAVKKNSWTIPAQSQLTINTSDMVSLIGNQQAAAIFDLSSFDMGSPSAIKGVFNMISPSTWSVSNSTLQAPSTSTASPTTLMMPWFSTSPGYSSKFFLLNRGATSALYSVSVMTEPGNVATLSKTTGVIPANSQISVDASTIVSNFSGPTRGSATFTIQAPNSQIDGTYQISNPSTGSVSNTSMIRPSGSSAPTSRLSVPWFSTNKDYISRFALMNRGNTPATFGMSLYTEKNNTPIQVLSSVVIPANSLYVVSATSIVSSFSASTRAAVVFDFSASDNQVDGLYNIVNPVTGSISNTMMLRDGTD